MIVARSSGWATDRRLVEIDRVVADEVVVGEVVAGRPFGVEYTDVLQGRKVVLHFLQSGEEGGVFEDTEPRATVIHEVLDLLRRRRVVDRDGRGTAEVGRHVEHVELRDVAHHQHDALARGHAHRLHPGRGPSDLIGVVAERPLAPGLVLVAPAQGDLITVGTDGLDEPVGHGLPRDRLLDLLVRNHRFRSLRQA